MTTQKIYRKLLATHLQRDPVEEVLRKEEAFGESPHGAQESRFLLRRLHHFEPFIEANLHDDVGSNTGVGTLNMQGCAVVMRTTLPISSPTY